MTQLVDEFGLALPPSTCPNCQAPDSDHQQVKTFGGHLRIVCMKCGHELKIWREKHDEEIQGS